MIDFRKLTLPLVVIGPLIGGALVAGGAWATSKADTAELEKRVAGSEARVSKLEEQRTDEAIERQAIKSDLKYIAKAMERLERALGTTP